MEVTGRDFPFGTGMSWNSPFACISAAAIRKFAGEVGAWLGPIVDWPFGIIAGGTVGMVIVLTGF